MNRQFEIQKDLYVVRWFAYVLQRSLIQELFEITLSSAFLGNFYKDKIDLLGEIKFGMSKTESKKVN